MTTILIVILVLLLLGAVPAYSYRDRTGLAPSSAIGLLVLIILIVLLLRLV